MLPFRTVDDQSRVVVEQAFDTRHRCCLANEVGKGEFDAAARSVQAQQHFPEHCEQAILRQRAAPAFEKLDEARHVGALGLGRQTNCHGQIGDGVHYLATGGFQLQRVAQSLDADVLDGQTAGVGGRLDVRQEKAIRCIHGSDSLDSGQSFYLRNSSIFFSRSVSSGLVKLE